LLLGERNDLIVQAYIRKVRESGGGVSAVVVIMDNFKGQVTEKILKLLDGHFIYPWLLPPNTTDRLQPMDVSVNKPAKTFMRK